MMSFLNKSVQQHHLRITEEHIPGNPKRPGTDICLPPEPVQVQEHPEEYLLAKILCQTGIPGHIHQVSIYGIPALLISCCKFHSYPPCPSLADTHSIFEWLKFTSKFPVMPIQPAQTICEPVQAKHKNFTFYTYRLLFSQKVTGAFPTFAPVSSIFYHFPRARTGSHPPSSRTSKAVPFAQGLPMSHLP